MTAKLNAENYLHSAFQFQDRQAGISLIYDPDTQQFTYNVYCLETKLMKELFTVEEDFLDDALELANDEFGGWELVELSPQKSGCGSCVAK